MTFRQGYSLAARRLLTLTLPLLPLGYRLRRLLGLASLVLLGLALARLPLPAAAALLSGAIFLVLLGRWPLLGLYLLIPLIPFSPLVSINLGGFKVGGMELLLAASLAAWLAQLTLRHYQASSAEAATTARPRPPLLVPFLLFLGGISLSWLNSLSIGASLVETAKWVEMLALYLFVLSLLPARQIGWVVAALLLAGMAQASLGLYQFVFKVGPEGFLLFGGRFLRAYGSFAQPNPYAGYLGLGLPLALAVAIWSLESLAATRLSGRTQPGPVPNRPWPASSRLQILLVLPFGLLLAAMAASQSRSAWLGFAVAAVVTMVSRSKKAALALTLAGLAGALVLLAGTFEKPGTELGPDSGTYNIMAGRFVEAISIFSIRDVATIEVNDANFATVERLAHWQAAREMWRDRPWLGVGFGNYEVIYPAYAVGRWLNPLGHAHNYLLNLGAETGLVGIIAYLIFWILTFRVTWLAIRRSQGFNQAVAAGCLGILTHLHIHNLFDNLYVQGMYLHLAIILALASIIYLDRSSQDDPNRL